MVRGQSGISPPPALAIANTTKSHADHQPHPPRPQPPRHRRQQPKYLGTGASRIGNERAAERHHRSAHGEPHRLRRSRRGRHSAHRPSRQVRRHHRSAGARRRHHFRDLRARRGGGKAG